MKRTAASHHTDEPPGVTRPDRGDASRDPSRRDPSGPGPAPRRNLVMLATGVALLAFAAAFAAVMAANPTRPFAASLDRWWLSVMTSWQAPPLTRAAKAVSYVAGPWGGTILVAILVILLLWRRRIWTAVFLALAEACGSGISQLMKHLVERPRPPHPLVQADFGSFPSGHVITTVVVGTTLTAVLARPGHRKFPLIGVAVAAAVIMLCRTYLHAHWLTDTFEGVLVGAGITLVLWSLFTPALLREQPGPLSITEGGDKEDIAA